MPLIEISLVQDLEVTPGKMTMRNAQLIEKLFFGRYSIGYLTRGTIKSYGPAH